MGVPESRAEGLRDIATNEIGALSGLEPEGKELSFSGAALQ